VDFSNFENLNRGGLRLRSDSKFPRSRLYGQVTVFRPAREAEVIVMQQITEIYGREDGWGDPTHHTAAEISHTAADMQEPEDDPAA